MSKRKKQDLRCSRCGSSRVHKYGVVPTVKHGKKQRYRCYECGHTFYCEAAQNE